MTTIAKLDSFGIRERLEALAAKIKGLEGQAAALAFDALNGDEAAIAKRAEIAEQIKRAVGDREMLGHALATAVTRERDEADRAAAANRKAHMARAGEHVETLIGLAAEADALGVRYWELLKAIEQAENAVFNELRFAGKSRDHVAFWGTAAASRFKELIDRRAVDGYGQSGVNFRFEDWVRCSWAGRLAAPE